MQLDGRKISEFTAAELPAFFATAGYNRQDKAVIVRATNYRPQPVAAEIRLDGARKIGKTGRHTVIQAPEPNAENSLDQPLRIVPQEKPLPDCGPGTRVTLPPYSVNVLSIPARAE